MFRQLDNIGINGARAVARRTVGAGSRDVRRVLFVSYPFPPVGGAGVQRTTKFVKYLPHWGWMPSVLTVANPSVPAWDKSLLKDVPPEVTVRRARTLEPGYAAKAAVVTGGVSGGGRRGLKALVSSALHGAAKLLLQPDPQVLWMPDAIRQGRRLLDEVRHDAIVASGPPFSTFLIGAALSRQGNIPLVLDYRDEWAISNAYLENKRLDRFSTLLQGGMQDRVVRAARALVATTRHSADELDRVRRRAGAGARVTWIYNGFDPEDFPPNGIADADTCTGAKQTYRLAYVGTLWNLTSVEPLVAGVERLARTDPKLVARLELVFAGRRTPEQLRILERLGSLPCKVVGHPYLDHDQALELVRSADGLCVLLSDVPAAERVVPAKIFEYMAARRPTVGIGPRGEMWDLLSRYPGARLHVPRDVEGIARTLGNEVERAGSGAGVELDGFDPSPFDRKSESRELANLLESIC